MPATVTLPTTTLADVLRDGGVRTIKLVSASGVIPGMCLFMDGELMHVLQMAPDPFVVVQRGVGGSRAIQHASGVTVYIGRPDQFYSSDPGGRPPDAVPVSPHINVITGGVFFAQGDVEPVGLSDRWWQPQSTVYGIGALGVRTKVKDPESST